jgi:hypothetical protein
LEDSMMDLDALMKGSPAVERATGGKDLIGLLGLVVTNDARPDYVSDPGAEFLKDQRDSWGPDWVPLPGPFTSMGWHLSNGVFEVPGCEVAAGDFLCKMGVGLGPNLVGVIKSGFGVTNFNSDGSIQFESLDGRNKVFLFVWSVLDIEYIGYSRLKKYMKMWEAEVSIVGRNGARLYGMHFKHAGTTRPNRHKSAVRDFADDIGHLRAENGMGAGTWSMEIVSDPGEKGETHRLTFT